MSLSLSLSDWFSQPQEVMAGAAEASGSRLRKGSGEILDAVDLAEELDFDDEAPGGIRWGLGTS